MSTFNGYIKEFGHIQIDYFRPRQPGFPAPLVGFLSHVHSDHLQGLEQPHWAGGFIYCTSTTKKLLLLLQTRGDRQNYDHGITEAKRYKYRHLKTRSRDLLKVLHINLPTLVQVGQSTLRVTAFDANHCPGAVSFLIEGEGKAVFYTGDTRCDDLCLASWKNNPILRTYTSRQKRLDCLYLDTTNTTGPDFKSKKDGLQNLLDEIAKYPVSTRFYFDAWCLGYEEEFATQLHVDPYMYSLFAALRHTDYTTSRYLVGGEENGEQGILTLNGAETRFHSCTRSAACEHRDDLAQWVHIKPVNHIIGIDSLQPLKSLHRVLYLEFARHSSLPELKNMVSLFRPLDIHPCVERTDRPFDKLCFAGDISTLPEQLSNTRTNSLRISRSSYKMPEGACNSASVPLSSTDISSCCDESNLLDLDLIEYYRLLACDWTLADRSRRISANKDVLL